MMLLRNEHRLPANARPDGWTRRWLPFVIVTAVYAAVAMHQLTLSGVYMDEVNPDYLVVRFLNWTGPPVPAAVLPGNYLFNRFPILVSLQHGTQTLWLGLPAFWLFGTTVAGLRITHALFAVGILAALYALLCASGVRRWWAAVVCAALAIDPSFIYAFRTQDYITLAPTAWLFLSLFALQRAAVSTVERHRWWLATSGLMLGLAFSGYFIYLFFAPAITLAVMAWADPGGGSSQRFKRLAYWTAGFCVGTLPYVIGYALLAQSLGGLAEGWAYIVDVRARLGGRANDLTPAERLAFFDRLIRLVFSNAVHHDLMFGKSVPVVGASLKSAFLIALPPLLWAIAEYRKRATPILRILLGMQISFVVCAMLFGTRLAGQHYVTLVPIAYATLALALLTIVVDVAAAPWTRWVYAAPFAILLGLNAAGDIDEAATLRETGGVGLYSDAINRFADDLLRERGNDFVFLPDWGLSMPAVFLTGGAVEMDTYENFPHARGLLCAGRDVSVALINGDRAARFAGWQRQLGWGAPTIKDYRQRDGAIVFSLGTFNGRDAAQWCPAPAVTAPVPK